MVDTQTVTEDALQALHHLDGQRYLRHKKQHLLFTLQCTLYQVNVYLCLTTRRHTMQQGHLFLHHRQQYLIVCLLLSGTKRLDEFRTIGTAMVQASHLHLVGLQHLSLFQLFQRCRRTAGDIHQFLAGHLCRLQFRLSSLLQLVPPRQRKILRKDIQLILGTCQHVERHMQGFHILILLGQSDIGLRLGPIAIFRLQTAWQGRLVHVAYGRKVIVADPVPLLQLGRCNDRGHIHHHLNRLYLIVLRLLVVDAVYQTDILLSSTEGDEHPYTLHHTHALRNGIGKGGIQWYR